MVECQQLHNWSVTVSNNEVLRLKAYGKFELYSIRTYSRGYYIGYAESIDETNWIRKDIWRESMYLFYNGNGCGRTGFGYAILV